MDGWLCQDCRSVNSPSASNCYSCWTPRKFAEAPDPATLPPGVTPEQAHAERQEQLRPKLGDARSSRRRSWIVLACITGTVAFSALNLAFLGAKGGSLGIALAFLSGEWSTFGVLVALSVVGGVLAVAAAIAWFVWFDRVLANVPALTGKWPEVSRVMAVVWWLIPVVGQLKGTFVVGHVYSLMAVAGSPGLWLLGLWGITWLGGTIAPGIAGFVVGWAPLPLEESVRLQDLISNVGQISYIAAGFFAAALILALEHARDVRMSGDAAAATAHGDGAPASPRTSPAPAWRGAPGSLPPPGSLAPPSASLASSGQPDGTSAWPTPATEPGVARSEWGTSSSDWGTSPTAWGTNQTEWGPTQTERGSQTTGWGTTEGDPAAPAWPGSATPWSAEPAPSWPGPEPAPLTSAAAVTNPDPFEPPAAAARRTRERGPVPFEPIVVMGALVLAGVVAGITMAGMADPLGGLGGVVGGGQGTRTTPPPLVSRPVVTPSPAASVPAATPGRTQAPTTGPAVPTPTAPVVPPPTAAPGTATPAPTPPGGAAATPVPPAATAAPTSAPPTPTPVPADLVARRLVRVVTDEDYRGLADIEATATDGSGETTWTVRLGRMGEREWRLQEVRRPGSEPEVLERASLVSTTWERGARTDWERRRKTERDRATPPLFDVTDASHVSFMELTEVDGVTLYRFAWATGDSRIDQFIRSIGGPEDLELVAGELLTTARGVPVHLELRLASEAAATPPATTMSMSVEYSEIGSEIEVRNPRIGPPLVVLRR